jgi:hypothetical protein
LFAKAFVKTTELGIIKPWTVVDCFSAYTGFFHGVYVFNADSSSFTDNYILRLGRRGGGD